MSTSTFSIPPLSGGIPIHSQDFVASIVFCIAYCVLLLPALWRLFSSSSRSLVLIRPTIFCITQAGAYALRAVIANGSQSLNVFKWSEILLLAGFSLICEPVPALLTRVVGGSKKARQDLKNPNASSEQRILALLRIAITIALILGILAATNVSPNETSSEQSTVKDYRVANSCLVLGAMAGSAIIAVHLKGIGHMSQMAMMVICIYTLLIIVTAAYKLISTLHPAGVISLTGKIVFYLLNSAVQWLVTLAFFVPNLNKLFPPTSTLDSVRQAFGQEPEYDMEMGPRQPIPVYGVSPRQPNPVYAPDQKGRIQPNGAEKPRPPY